MQRKSIFAAVLVACTVAVAGSFALRHGPGKAPTAAPPATGTALQAATAQVQLRTLPTHYAADAVIEAVRQATVSAQLAGVITQFHVDAGDRVRRGQVLAHIDTREADAQVAAGRANLAQADAALAQARLSYERTASLVKQGFVSQAALDRADADLKSAQAAVEVARAGSTQAGTARSFAELRAPIDGVVTRRLLEVGELAAPGKPVLELHDPTALRAVAGVPQFVVAKLVRGAVATVELPGLAASVRATRVTVLPSADARLLSTTVRAELPPNLAGAVMPGIAAKVLLPTGMADKLVLPAAAVLRRSELAAVYVINEQGASVLRQIRLGETLGDGLVEVLAGLAAGERVLLDPLTVVVR